MNEYDKTESNYFYYLLNASLNGLDIRDCHDYVRRVVGEKFRSRIKDDTANKLGISWLWALPETHPLTPAGWVHDQLYKSDVSKNMSRREADLVFLKICNAHAGNSWKLKAQAHLFYRLVRIFGGKFWEGRP